MRLSNLDGRRGVCASSRRTKPVGLDQIREGITAVLSILGENHRKRRFPISRGCGATGPVAFYGHLQRGKVRSVVGVFYLIHSVDSLELAEEMDRRAQKVGLTQAVLLEVSFEGEATKAGFLSDELDRAMPSLGPCLMW